MSGASGRPFRQRVVQTDRDLQHVLPMECRGGYSERDMMKMIRRNAEGRTCEICGRRMLTGETYHVMDNRGRRQYRRSVCTLCRRRALNNGWEPTQDSASRPPDPDDDD